MTIYSSNDKRNSLLQILKKKCFIQQAIISSLDPPKLCYNSPMKIGILGYGKEGKSAEQYFQKQGAELKIFDNFTNEELKAQDFSQFDLVLRSPSVHPAPQFSSMTRYFFDHCPCPIIGVTGTKGKGTTCTLITDLLTNLNQKVHLVGNIGKPALDVLDQLKPDHIIVYEMSSFQLWDLQKSPHIAVILGIEADHLNVHDSYDDYISAKANITKYQTSQDTCIYFKKNPDTTEIATKSAAKKMPYPILDSYLDQTIQHLAIPGQHNRENAQAALLAVASYLELTLDTFLRTNHDIILKTLENFHGLPHRLEYLRTLNNVKYYDDNFSTTPTSLKVALEAFPNQKIILIAGGRDKTENHDLPEVAKLMQSPNVAEVILIGESGRNLYQMLQESAFPKSTIAKDLSNAVHLAATAAKNLTTTNPTTEVIVLMSPAAASFDMFDNVYDRGTQFQKLIQDLS